MNSSFLLQDNSNRSDSCLHGIPKTPRKSNASRAEFSYLSRKPHANKFIPSLRRPWIGRVPELARNAASQLNLLHCTKIH